MESIIQRADRFIQSFFAGESSGHDYFHSQRVCRLARALAEAEGADLKIVSLAALLHDVDDRKISPETCETQRNAVEFLQKEQVPEEEISRIRQIISEVSFQGTDSKIPATVEGKCVQDADRLDALGAIGIARTFAYGGHHNRPLYDPAVLPVTDMDGDTYRNHVSPSVNHFYEKLFLLKDMMNTPAARRIAEERERYMKAFLERFLSEWESTDFGTD